MAPRQEVVLVAAAAVFAVLFSFADGQAAGQAGIPNATGESRGNGKVYGIETLNGNSLNDFIMFLQPQSSKEVLDDIVNRVSQLTAIERQFRVVYKWERINAFVITGASKTMAMLVAELPEVEFGALIDLKCRDGTTGLPGCCV